MMYSEDDVVRRCRKGPIKARSLGQLSGLPTIEQIDDVLSPSSDNDVDLARPVVGRVWQVGGFRPMAVTNN